MDFDLFRKIIRDCVVSRVPLVDIHGYGEPLLDGRLAERIRYIKSHSPCWVTVTTNGSLLTGPKGAELISAGLDYLVVSLDPGNTALHDRKRSPLSHAEIVENLERLLFIKNALSVSHPKVYLSSVVYEENQKDVAAFLNRWGPRVDGIWLHPLTNWGGAIPVSEPCRAIPCKKLWFNLAVLWDGSVVLCCADHSGRHFLGNLRNSSLMDIWTAEPYHRIRRASLQGRLWEGLLCKTCTLPQADSPLWIGKVLFS